MQIAYGTDTGVYFSDLRDRSRNPVQVLALPDIIQVDVLEEYELLVVLSGVLHVLKRRPYILTQSSRTYGP